jgi:hypothetical protein
MQIDGEKNERSHLCTTNGITQGESMSVKLAGGRNAISKTGPQETYVWNPQPINVWVSMPPYNDLQAYLLVELRQRLEAAGCIFVDTPDQDTPLGSVAHLAIGFGKDIDEECSPFTVYGKLPKPRGNVLMISLVDEIGSDDLFGMARRHITTKACHMGIIVEGNPKDKSFQRALWGSMAGNNRLLEGDTREIIDNLALRVLAHAGAERVSLSAGNDINPELSWEAWSASPVHKDIADAAQALGRANIIENEIPLPKYASGEQVRTILRFLDRAALGEGMRSQLDPALHVMGVTTTGGDKIKVSTNPVDGQVVPISKLTWNGYIMDIPQNCPIRYNPPSIETHENGLIYLAGALINAGLIENLDDFLEYLKQHFSENETIDILPPGMQPKATAIDHFHRQPQKDSIKNPALVEVVYPDVERFPEIDFPCGVREGGLQLLSGVFRSKAFTQQSPLEKLVITVLPGHGSVAIYNGPRSELTNLLVNGMVMEEVTRV